MVFVLLENKFNKNRVNNIFESVYSVRSLLSNVIITDLFIDFHQFTSKINAFSTPKVLIKP